MANCIAGYDDFRNTLNSTNKPLEIVLVEPGPAGCGGSTNVDSSNHDPVTVLTPKDCNQAWDTKFVYSTDYLSSTNDGVYSYSNSTLFHTSSTNPGSVGDSTQEGTIQWVANKPGLFYRYHLPAVKQYLDENPDEDFSVNGLDGFEMDKYGGHPQVDNDWHMHVGDILLDDTFKNCVVGYALDGTPIIGGLNSTVYDSDGNIVSNKPKSNWRRRDVDSEYTATYAVGNGLYHYDYIFDNTSGSNLDHFNGAYTRIDNQIQYAYFFA